MATVLNKVLFKSVQTGIFILYANIVTEIVYSCIQLLEQCASGDFRTHIICTLEIEFSRNRYTASKVTE